MVKASWQNPICHYLELMHENLQTQDLILYKPSDKNCWTLRPFPSFPVQRHYPQLIIISDIFVSADVHQYRLASKYLKTVCRLQVTSVIRIKLTTVCQFDDLSKYRIFTLKSDLFCIFFLFSSICILFFIMNILSLVCHRLDKSFFHSSSNSIKC